MASSLPPPGFGFMPTDEELIIHYMKPKTFGKPFPWEAIAEVDIHKYEPWDLPDKSRLKTSYQEWYFVVPLGNKYENEDSMKRTSGLQGYWKVSGKDYPVKHDQKTVGLKKIFVFHNHQPSVEKTNWVMHEYRLADEELERERERALSGHSQPLEEFVLCKVIHKNPRNGQLVEQESENESEQVPRDEPVNNGTDVRHSRLKRKGLACNEGRNLVVQETPHNIETHSFSFSNMSAQLEIPPPLPDEPSSLLDMYNTLQRTINMVPNT